MAIKTPAAVPPFDPSRADMRLPQAALKFRLDNMLVTAENLRRLNITAWLYRDKQGNEGIKVNPNTTIAELIAQFGPADTRDAEVGIHSEGRAGEFFRTHPDLTVVQIFTERIPCREMCAPMLSNNFRGIPVFYYYDKRVWEGEKSATEILAGAYGIDLAKAALAQLTDQFVRLRNAKDATKGEHVAQLNLIRHSWNPMGRAVQVFNPVATPELSIWDDVEDSLDTVRDLLKANNFVKAGAFLVAAGEQYKVALKKFVKWKNGFETGAGRTYVAIGVISVAIIVAAAAVFAVGAAAAGAAAGTATEGAAATTNAAQTLIRIQLLSEQADTFIRIASSEGEAEPIIEEILKAARALP
ncbi:MAG: hypothetical protein LAQ69_07505 [Acidobacteriia bacterium]|nr:hypothetical protein [Terriglobia bacterium]